MKVKEVTSAKTKPALITASEVARHIFCARALAYDRQHPQLREQSLSHDLIQIITTPWKLGIIGLALLALALIYEPLVAVAAFFATTLMFLLARWLWGRLRRASSVIIYQETRAQRNRRSMVAQEFGLSGRPDYLLQVDAQTIIPVLTKQNPAPESPHDAHIMQIVAHCLLVAETTRHYPPYGVIRYGDGRTFEIDFDEDAVEILSQLMDEIEADRRRKDVSRNHEERARCYACSHRARCDQNLFT